MFQRKLRRAFAVLALTFAATFAAAPGASAAVHLRGARPAEGRTIQRTGASRLLETLSRVLGKAGIEIDPNGFLDSLFPILSDGGR